MPRYVYYKATSKLKSGKDSYKFKKLTKIIPNTFILFGIFAVFSVFTPFVSHEINKLKWGELTNLSEPLIAYQENHSGPEVIDNIDYTKIDNWFSKPIPTSSTHKNTFDQSPSTYTISIPKVNIEDMIVTIGGENLDKTLIQYEGTAYPGELGNPVIFGHSVLPVFYNPKSYISVFSKIPTLEKGDEIYITYDNVLYKYLVNSYHEVEPDQIELLEQRYDRRTLTLVTCVPPGTYLRRGVILAQLSE